MDDALTQLNTELNKSMILMDPSSSKIHRKKASKRKSISKNTSITFNTSISSTPDSTATTSKLSDSISPRRGILRTPEENELNTDVIRLAESSQQNEDDDFGIVKIIERPRSLEEFRIKESLKLNTTPCSFNLTDLDEDDELWLIDIPTSIKPEDLRGQTINFNDKSKLKVGDDRFVAVPSNGPECFTCVLGTGKQKKPYKCVNIQTSGTIVVRKKLPGPIKRNLADQDDEKDKVPFPNDLKVRHPLLGVPEGKKKKKKKKKSKRTE